MDQQGNEKKFNVEKDGIVGIYDWQDFEKYLRKFFQLYGESDINQIRTNLEVHPYRLNKDYLKFLASTLIMAAEFGFPMIEGMTAADSRLRLNVESSSRKDFLDPRNLVLMAKYFAQLMKYALEKKLEFFERDWAFGVESSRKTQAQGDREMRSILAGYIKPQGGSMKTPTDIRKLPEEWAPNRANRRLPEGFVYDVELINNVLSIPSYELEDVPNLMSEDYMQRILPSIIAAFPGIDIESVFKTEFEVEK